MLKQVQRLPFYFGLVIFFLSAAISFNIFFSKTASFVLLNGFHNRWLDSFFTVYTFLGDGTISIAAFLLLVAFRKRKKAATLFLAYLSSGLAAQTLKSIYRSPRPKLYFEQTFFKYSHFVEGVTSYNSNSFPSGHTTSAFAMATVLVLTFKKHRITLPCFLAAALVGYSRIYLAQHFLQDVITGACLGVSCSLLSYQCVWENKKLLKLFKPARRKKQAPEAAHPQWI